MIQHMDHIDMMLWIAIAALIVVLILGAIFDWK